MCVLAVFVGLLRGSAARSAALGILLYLAYITSVGGDFMSGRLIAPPAFLASVLLVPALRGAMRASGILAMVALLAVVAPAAPLRTSREYRGLGVDDHGIADERGIYFAGTGLRFYRAAGFPTVDWFVDGLRFRDEAARVRRREYIGMFGFAAGPTKVIIDPFALTDPLLARLPLDPATPWRIGHFMRELPEGYFDSVASGENRVADPDLRTYYERLRLIVSGPVFGAERWRAVIAMNAGMYDRHLRAYVRRRSAAGPRWIRFFGR
jgi:arabinofuranosyltransferase